MNKETTSKGQNILRLAAYIVSAQVIGLLSSVAAGDIAREYRSLRQPPLSPPSAVFPVVWVILFLMMAVSVWLVSKSGASDGAKRRVYILYWTQLAVNFLWSPAFFRFGKLWLAVLILVLLIAAVAELAQKARRIDRWAGFLLYPYIAWLLFALYLNVGTALLNR